MTRKEQNKILDDKIKANKRQYDLDRINVEISAYSSGDLPKYQYLTKKDLGYKPDAFEQAKFEYSPLNKVFIDGLDKSSRKEGLLKKLKNIEDRSNNQLLALRDINRPEIRGRNGDDDSDNVKDEYKTIQDFKQELIDKNILHLDCNQKIDNIINKWKQTKDKKFVYKNVDDKVSTKKSNIYKSFENYLYKKIDKLHKLHLDVSLHLLTSIPSEISILSYSNIFIILIFILHTNNDLTQVLNKIYFLFQLMI